METQILIADGVTQIILTPETDGDKAALKMIRECNGRAKMKDGQFKVDRCLGGYYRQFQADNSLMIVIEKVSAEAEQN